MKIRHIHSSAGASRRWKLEMVVTDDGRFELRWHEGGSVRRVAIVDSEEDAAFFGGALCVRASRETPA